MTEIATPRTTQKRNVSTDTAKKPRNQNAAVTHLKDIYTNTVRRLRMLAASLEPHTEPRFIKQNDGYNQQNKS